MSIFAERLKTTRVQKGYQSQEAFAAAVGLDRVTINFYENDKRRPDTNTLKKISEILDCSCDYLLGTDNYEKKGMEELRLLLGLSETSIDTLVSLNYESTAQSFIPHHLINTINFLLEHINVHLDNKQRHDLLSLIHHYIQFCCHPKSRDILKTGDYSDLSDNILPKVISLEINEELEKIRQCFIASQQENSEDKE